MASTAVFAYDLDEAVEIHLPSSWTPTIDALTSPWYASDEYLMAQLGLLDVTSVDSRENGLVTIGGLHA